MIYLILEMLDLSYISSKKCNMKLFDVFVWDFESNTKINIY